jgi:hypothetical protein
VLSADEAVEEQTIVVGALVPDSNRNGLAAIRGRRSRSRIATVVKYHRSRLLLGALPPIVGVMALVAPPAAAVTSQRAAATRAPVISPVTDVSSACAGQNAEVEQAVDQTLHYVYEAWIGCLGIGFAGSVDGGLHFSAPISIPRSFGPNGTGWDPAITVGNRGEVYVAFMQHGTHGGAPVTFPVVAVSFDHGATFPQVSSLIPPDKKNWGDRDYIAVAPDGSVYVTWDYGPKASLVTFICAPNGSCSFATGDLNVVIQKSTDGGKTWGPIIPMSPGFPASGGDSAPMVIEPNGRIDALYQGYKVLNTRTYALAPAHPYFVSSTDGGVSWTYPVQVGPKNRTMSMAEWWIDSRLGMDAAGNLYATWDTQEKGKDIGWLSYSADHGQHWSTAILVPRDQVNVPHIMEVAGGSAGVAYVGWLSDSSPKGYAMYLRPYSISKGWLSEPIVVSGNLYGNPGVWPGDTFGISTLSAKPGGRELG